MTFLNFYYFFREILGGQLGSAILKDGNPLVLHYVMFIPTVMGQGTYEQQAEWIQRAWSCEMIGTYAQVNLILNIFHTSLICFFS